MKGRDSTKVLAALGVTIVVWASAFAGIRIGLRGFGPGQLALLRFAIASIVLLVYALATRLPLPKARDLLPMLVLGFLGFFVYHVGLNAGERVVPAGAASFIISTVPVFSTLLAVFLLKERPTVLGWIGIAISFAGVTLIALGSGSGFRFEPAALLIVVAAAAESIYFVLQKPFLERYSALQLTTYTIWTGTICMLVFLPGLVRQLPVAPLASTLSVVYLGIFPAAIGYVLWSYALSKSDVSKVTSMLNVSPILAFFIAFVWLGEIPSSIAIIGGVITVAGVVVLNTLGKRRTPAAPRPGDSGSDGG